MQYKILKCFIMDETKLSNYLMIILQLQLRLTIKHRERIKVLMPKQMLQRLSIVFAQVKTGNTLENLLNKIRQIIYSCINQKNY